MAIIVEFYRELYILCFVLQVNVGTTENSQVTEVKLSLSSTKRCAIYLLSCFLKCHKNKC